MKDKGKNTELSTDELAELRQAKSHLATIMDSSMDAIVLTDSAGYIVRVNNYFLQLLGYQQDEVRGKHISAFGPSVNTTYTATTGDTVYINQDYFENTRKMYQRFVEEKKATNWQSYLVSKEEKLIPVEHNVRFFHDERGTVLGALGIIRDISQRSKTVQALEDAKQFLELIFQTSVDGLLVVDPEGSITMVNKALEDMFGYAEDELLGKSTSLLRPPGEKYAQEGREFIEKLFDHGIVHGIERIGQKKDGDLINLEINSVSLKDKEGKYLGRLASYKDISERKRSEEVLLASEEKYRGVVNNIGIGIALISPDMEIVSLNNQMQKWFPEADVTKKPICYRTFNIPPRESVCSYCPTYKTLEDGQVHEAVTDTPHGDEIIHYRIIASPLKDKDGKVTSAIEMVEDITERIMAEQQLLDYQNRLKALTSQITLTEEKERRRFADYLHNEIGQYLVAAKIQLEQLKGPLSSAGNARNVDNILSTIKQMIANSRSLTFELSSPILYELGFEKALEWLAEHAYEKYNIVVAFENDEQEKPLDDDVKAFLYRAVNELLTNVAKHAQTDKASVSLKRDTTFVRIIVEDNGIGFDPHKKHAFNEMDSAKGFGIFSINERIEQLGGRLEIASQPNRGTHITLVAPLSTST